MKSESSSRGKIRKRSALAAGKPIWIGKDGKRRFSPANMGLNLMDQKPMAREPGPKGRLWVYQDGQYHDDGEESINLAVTEAIGQGWNPQQSKSTVEFIRQRAPAFVEQPPSGIAIV